jgi:hypothetical protein
LAHLRIARPCATHHVSAEQPGLFSRCSRSISILDCRQTGSNRVDEKPACITECLKNVRNFANLHARVAIWTEELSENQTFQEVRGITSGLLATRGQTVATKARRCSATTRFISAVSLTGASFISAPGFDQKSFLPLPGGLHATVGESHA